MNKSKNASEKDQETKELSATATIESLIADLGSKNKTTRLEARWSLLAKGESVVKPLVEALANRNDRVRWEAGRILDEMDIDWSRHADTDTLRALINDLKSTDGTVRVRARRSLVTVGTKAVGGLQEALRSKEGWTRWEAAKTLEEIGDPVAIEILIAALRDEMFDVRWLAAEGLLAIGRQALAPLLKAIIEQSDSEWLREGAHHVFHGLKNENLRAILQPVTRALEDTDAPVEVPVVAEVALKRLMDS